MSLSCRPEYDKKRVWIRIVDYTFRFWVSFCKTNVQVYVWDKLARDSL